MAVSSGASAMKSDSGGGSGSHGGGMSPRLGPRKQLRLSFSEATAKAESAAPDGTAGAGAGAGEEERGGRDRAKSLDSPVHYESAPVHPTPATADGVLRQRVFRAKLTETQLLAVLGTKMRVVPDK